MKREQLKRTVCILKLKVRVFDVYLCIWMYNQCVPVYLDVHQCIHVYLDVHQCVPVYTYLDVHQCVPVYQWLIKVKNDCVYLSYCTLEIIIEICQLVA